MNIVEKTTEIKTYEVNGKTFSSKEDADIFVKTIEKLTEDYLFYTVKVDPDLTEGRGYYNEIIIASYFTVEENAVFAYLMNSYGNPVSLVQGVSPMKSYVLLKPKNYSFEDLIKNEIIFLDALGNESEKAKKTRKDLDEVLSRQINID